MATIDTNETPPVHYRSLGVFFVYLTIVASLALTCCRTIYVRYQARKKNNDWNSPKARSHAILFIFLTALTLGITWFYMISLFFHSYHEWTLSPTGLAWSAVDMPITTRMGLWLKETYLFQEAWETVVETPKRFWWSGQIFGWCIGWGLFLGIAGRRYNIPHIWVYMLLGQLASIAFGANFFFATIAVSPRPNEKDLSFAWYPAPITELLVIVISFVDTLAVPIFAHKKEFMPILMAPHLLTFVPGMLGPQYSARVTKPEGERTTQRYIVLLQWVAAVAVVLQAYFTYLAVLDIGVDASYAEIASQLLDALYAHPACSSVSWDVIMCNIGFLTWAVVHGFDASKMLGGY
ncbi:hypothetical protein N7532_002342 [Penicillium argentinense]|uniref:Uncharacterized protein n=1 Tax=Penicillium argentinense TaxID=1131581 RepID=A0A9W9KLG1_9EURO|nr:uncharacterized protein N7532_002342 [Penicillium argentinense]KAJ5109697.1 hypothetical protein N7532_002342 [Penicillium argentinense]